MNESDVQVANDEDEDIYKDIGDFRFDRELTKLEESNKAYSEDIARLSKRIDELTKKNEELQNINDILATNISILLKTAKAEINRKQLVIDEFRKKIESSSKGYGRNDRVNSLRSGSVNKTADEDQTRGSDIEDGEIVGDSCEVERMKSERRRRDGSKSRDRGYHIGKHENRQSSRERLRGRSNETCSSRRKSKYPDDNYSRHSSSSRSHNRYTSLDNRGRSDDRSRSADKSRHSSKSIHSHGLRSQKTDIPSHKKEEPPDKSRDRRRSTSKTVSEKLKKNILTNQQTDWEEKPSEEKRKIKPPDKEEKPSKPDCMNNNKSKTVGRSGTKREEKEVEDEEKYGVMKTLSLTEYRQRKSGDSSCQKKSECDIGTRRSVLADLYDEPQDFKTFTEAPRDVRDEKDTVEEQSGDGEGNYCSWPDSITRNLWKNKDSQVKKGPMTLYSRRMEAKFQRKKLLEDGLSKKCSENVSEMQLDKKVHSIAQVKSEQNVKDTATLEAKDNDGEKENTIESPQAGKEAVARVDSIFEAAAEVSDSVQKPTEVSPEQSFSESLVKKLLQLQQTEENVGINEFSPLKNNYKLSKISPLKPVSKQHILEYYNLKPSPQQLTNIEPEVLDFSFSLPETPGKNFLSSFLSLNDTKECVLQQENDSNDKCSANSPELENSVKSGIDDLITVTKATKTKRKNCKTAKGNIGGDETPSESKKSLQISDEEKGHGKSYNTRYHIRTRSKAENDKSDPNESEDFEEKRNRNCCEEESGLKRERRLSLSDEVDLGLAPKRMKCETPKTENETSIEVTAEGTVPDDITSFEVFRSVSDENVGGISTPVARVGEKNTVDDLPLWNGAANKIAPNEDESCEIMTDKVKTMLSSTGNSGDSSNFKVLRSYLMLSANDDTDDEAFDSDSSSRSGEYSDSGASALVDLL